MNKTIVFSVVFSVGIVTCGAVGISHLANEKEIEIKTIEREMKRESAEKEVALKTETRDRLTVCMQMAMQESRESGQPIDIGRAREVCG